MELREAYGKFLKSIIGACYSFRKSYFNKIHLELGGHLLKFWCDDNPSTDSEAYGMITKIIWKVTKLKVRIPPLQ